jgi:hypothetical protein
MGDARRDAAKWLQRRQVVRTAEQCAANAVPVRLNEVIETKTDTAVSTRRDSRNRITRLCTLEAVHRALLGAVIVDRK